MAQYDVIIVGAGPAGMTAAIYAASGHECSASRQAGPGRTDY